MKSNLENNIKQSLENFELPYDPAAWKVLNSRLDAKMPTQTVKPKGKGGMLAASVIAVVGLTAALIYFNQPTDAEKLTQEEHTLENQQNKDIQDQSGMKAKADNKQSPVSQNHSTITEEKKEIGEISRSASDGNGLIKKDDVAVDSQVITVTNKSESNDPKEDLTQNGTKDTNQKITWIAPKVGSVCQNEMIDLVNSNADIIYVQAPNGNTKRIPANSSLNYKTSEAGNYSILVLEKEGSKSIGNFFVKPAEKIDFSIDNITRFNNGLPTTPLTTNASGNNWEWTFSDSKVKLYGSSVDAHFYTSGSKTITLSVKGLNGCISTASRTIDIEENYNLMAITGFYPLGVDSRTNRFMPLALIDRNTPFNMIIIDPKDGGIVFETKSADIPWDGIDKRNGKLVENSSTFIWKVTLQTPEPGERSEYSGMITRL